MTIRSFDPGDKVFFDRDFTKAAGQVGIPVNVTVVMTLRHEKDTVVTPAPTVTTVVTNGVAACTANYLIPRLNTSAGMWYVAWTSSVDIVSVETEAFHVRTDPTL